MNWPQNRGKVAPMFLKTLLSDICWYTHCRMQASPLKLEFHKFQSQNIVKICGFRKSLYIVYGGRCRCKAPSNTSKFPIFHSRTHPYKILFLYQVLKFVENANFCISKPIVYSWFRQHVLTKCWPTCYSWKVSHLSFQMHYQTSI